MTTETLGADEAAHLAGELIDRRRIPQARRLLGEALARDPDHAGLLYQSALADWHAGAHGSARATLERLVERVPDDIATRGLLLTVLIVENELERAEELGRAMVEQFPGWPPALIGHARVKIAAGDLPKARALVADALRISPDNADALETKVLCDIVEGCAADPDALGRLLQQSPEDRSVLMLAMHAHSHMGRHGEALRIARDLLRSDPTDPEAVRAVRKLSFYAEHWLAIPLWPIRRWGMAKMMIAWVVVLPFTPWLEHIPPPWLGRTLMAAPLVHLAYCMVVWPVIAMGWHLLRGRS